MKIFDCPYHKEFVFNLYSRICPNFKDYEKITKKKMLEKIVEFYSDYNNIIDICTYREIIFLKMIVDGYKFDLKDYDKYEFEISNLRKKMLINYAYVFYEELDSKIREALSKVKMNEVKKKTELNEFLVGFCKVMGNFLIYPLIDMASTLFKRDSKEVFNHVFNNKLFNYYVVIYDEYIEAYDEELPVGLYYDYHYVEDELNEARKRYGIGGTQSFNLLQYKNIFYDDFDFANKVVKKFCSRLKELPFFWPSSLEDIRVFALLNKDRQSLMDAFRKVPALKNIDLDDFFVLMNEAMDEMPSGALNGMTPREYKEKVKEQEEYEAKKATGYVRQKDACLGESISKGFYNLYFSLLEYTNNKYHVNTNIKKIYKQEGLDPNLLNPIVEFLFTDKEKIIDAYIKDNPHSFSRDDLDKISKFKQGIRGMFTIAKYEEDYTAILANDRVYMIKGLNCNIDEVIPYQDIPCIIITTLLPYNGVIVYDGMLSTFPISMGASFNKLVEKEYEEDMKYYHL